ncbi:MAG: PKD domain-containing protein, partial [Deltaproteobacteria bacterium]|nr:PKD domain-containing protein [Deltaproteobacteria bacterium]
HDLAVTLSGTQVHAFLDAGELISASDDRHPAGFIGVNAGDEAWFDDVVVSRLSELPNQPPRATATATPTAGDAPLTVELAGSGSDDDGTVVAYAWTLTDGSTSDQRDLTHTFDTAGSFVATLTVTDDDGASASASVTILVYEPAPAADGSAGPSAVGRGCTCAGSRAGPEGVPLVALVALYLVCRRGQRSAGRSVARAPVATP